MSDRPIAWLMTYEDIVAVLRERRRALGLSQTALNELAGLKPGRVEFVESLRRGSFRNSLYPDDLSAMMRAMNVFFVVLQSTAKQLPESLVAQGFRALPAEKNALAARAAKGGRKRALMLSPKRRSEIARRAAFARWR